jgi:hypothetical protein
MKMEKTGDRSYNKKKEKERGGKGIKKIR